MVVNEWLKLTVAVTLTSTGHSLSNVIVLSASTAVWLTIATMATDIFVRITYALAIPRNNINVTKWRFPNVSNSKEKQK